MSSNPITLFTKTRQKIGSILVGTTSGGTNPLYTIKEGRIFHGFKSFDASDQVLYHDCVNNGPFVLISLGRVDLDTYKIGDAVLEISITFAKTKQGSWEGFDVDDLVIRAMGRIIDPSNYSAGSTPPKTVAYEGVQYEMENTPGLAIARIRVAYFGALCSGDEV